MRIKYVIALVIFLVFSFNKVFAIEPEIIYAIDPQNAKFLHYFHLENKFDSAFVEFTVGEFNIHSRTGLMRINLDSSKCSKIRTGSSVQGVDDMLSSVMLSEKFIIPMNPSLSFFRMMCIMYPCNQVNPGGVASTKKEARWTVGTGRIKDLQELKIVLEDANTGLALCTIDSVGIEPNNFSPKVNAYGTSPNNMSRRFNIPDSLVGREVLIRFIPKRIGETLWGMNLHLRPSEYSCSAVYEYNDNDSIPGNIFKFGVSYFKELSKNGLAKFIQRVDSVLEQTGMIPELPIMIPVEWKDYIEKRYNSPIIKILNSKMTIESTDFSICKFNNIINFLKITNVNSGIKFKINSPYTYPDCKVYLLNCWGKVLFASPINNIIEGENEFLVTFEGLVNTESFYIAVKTNKILIGATKFFYEK